MTPCPCGCGYPAEVALGERPPTARDAFWRGLHVATPARLPRVDRMRQSDDQQRQDWNDLTQDRIDMPPPTVELTQPELDSLLEQTRAAVVCVHCGRRQE